MNILYELFVVSPTLENKLPKGRSEFFPYCVCPAPRKYLVHTTIYLVFNKDLVNEFISHLPLS